MTDIKVAIAQVSVGYLTVEMLENISNPEEFYIGVSQIADLFQLAKEHATRDVKSLLGKDFQLTKVLSPLNPKAVNAVPLSDFERVILELAFKGNQLAINMSRSLIGLSLHQLACDAFNREFEKQHRQAYLEKRQSTIDTRNDFEDAVEVYKARHKKELSSNSYIWMYKHATDHYKTLFNVSTVKLRKILNTENPRDEMSIEDLDNVETIEKLAARLITIRDMEPKQAITAAFKVNLLQQKQVTHKAA